METAGELTSTQAKTVLAELIERDGLYKRLYLRQISPAAQGDNRGNGKGAPHA